jgi:hypothetical protein
MAYELGLFVNDVWYSDYRVQWFHAEAEMQRWQEQVELKLAELI